MAAVCRFLSYAINPYCIVLSYHWLLQNDYDYHGTEFCVSESNRQKKGSRSSVIDPPWQQENPKPQTCLDTSTQPAEGF